MSSGQRKPMKAIKTKGDHQAQIHLGKMFLWWSGREAGLHELQLKTLKGKLTSDFSQPRG
jgi:hypothetical protein